MRLHTDTHTWATIREALDRAKRAGQVAQHVHIETLDERGSRSKARAFEISLRAYNKIEGDGRRRPNQNTGERELWAATYDEWGWFIAELFSADPTAIFGTYDGVSGFDAATNYKFTLAAA